MPAVMQPSQQPSPAHDGEIQLIVGPMFSGKSTELMRRIRRYGFAKKSCLVLKYAKDCRYGTAE